MRTILSSLAVALAAATSALSAASAQPDTSSAGQMAAAAEAFLATLDNEQRALGATASLDDDETRDAWSNLPAAMVPRDGVAVGDLTDAQRVALHALLASSLSAQGYTKAALVMWVDDLLHEMGQGMIADIRARGGEQAAAGFAPIAESWSAMNYWVKVYGDPADARWAWVLNGHHLALSFTVVDGRLAFTPMFFGAEPEIVETGRHAGWRVLPQEAQRGLELMQSLDPEQRARALLSEEVDSAAFIGAGRKGAQGEPAGLPASELNADQQALLWALIQEYVGNVDHDAANEALAAIGEAGLDSLTFSWMGPSESARQRYFYRLHGPTLLIDYMREPGVGVPEGNHIHTIVRDPRNDYGEDWLARHYDEAHARGDGPPERAPAAE